MITGRWQEENQQRQGEMIEILEQELKRKRKRRKIGKDRKE